MNNECVKNFFIYLKENRAELEKTKELYLESGSYMLSDSIGIDGQDLSYLMFADNSENMILDELIENDQRIKELSKEDNSAKKTVKKSHILSLFEDMTEDFMTNVLYSGQEKITRLGEKRRHLFEKLSTYAKNDGFDLTADDLQYYVGEEIKSIVNDNNDDISPQQILTLLLDRLSK